MYNIGTIFSGIRTADHILNKVLSKKGTRIDEKIIAVDTLQRAINSTEIFLKENNRNYQPNENLSNLWLNVFTAMVKIDKSLARRLRDKSKFWSNPQEWLWNDGAMELIPDLQELNESCEIILIELEKRK